MRSTRVTTHPESSWRQKQPSGREPTARDSMQIPRPVATTENKLALSDMCVLLRGGSDGGIRPKFLC